MEPEVNTFSSSNWLREKMMARDHEVKAVFVLKHDSAAVAAFEKNLIDIATPSSKNYGKWLKPADISARLSPSEDKVKAVKDFLLASGVEEKNIRVSKFRDMIHITTTASVASTMLQTEFGMFRSILRRDVLIPRITKPYFLPEEIAQYVSLVDDILRFPSIRNSPQVLGVEAPSGADDEFSSCGTRCSGFTTPAVLQSAYKYGAVKTVAPGNSMSVAEFQTQFYDQADLTKFSSTCGVTTTVDDRVGINKPDTCSTLGCTEALLDIEYIEAVANPIPLTVVFSVSFSLLDWVDTVISLDNPPLVHSVSYGNDEVQQTSIEYMNSVNEQFMIAGSMGLSILFASGDQGVWGRSGVASVYHPDFPAASPYVTAVGGTDFATKSTIGAETAWSCGGGGFSDTFAQPSWQADVVNAYLTKAAAAGVLPKSSYFNATGRGYPDVAALGGQVNPYCVSSRGGTLGGVAGTSASCPVVAGIFAQLNNVRLAAGKTPLGWLNPFIYANSACFNDVSDGSQNNCNAGTQGFAALSGWDPATGFGSPNYECLAKVV